MILKKIVCDRCEKVIVDSKKPGSNASAIFDALFGVSGKDGGLEYVEITALTLNGENVRSVHLCEECFKIAEKALNESKDK